MTKSSLGEYVLYSPFMIPISSKKSFSLNLNQYRNAHYHVLNKAKVAYKEYMLKQIEGLPPLLKISLHIVIYPKTKRKFDVGNIGSVTEKFLLDALVQSDKLPEDNYTFVPSVKYSFGEIDKLNPRIEVRINEI